MTHEAHAHMIALDAPSELAPDPTGRIKVTVTCYYSPERANYKFYDDADGNKVERTDEEINALTIQDMMDEDKKNFESGDFGYEELLDWSGEDPKVTLEVEE